MTAPHDPSRRRAGLALLGIAGIATWPAHAQTADFREITWAALVPPGWDPYKGMREKDVDRLVDGTAQAANFMKEMRAIWDTAPMVDTMAGQRIKLPGYVVPLEDSRKGVKEFLLVPYFGACIHTPPPPANQIVHVVSAKPVKGFATMDVVWVSGTMRLARHSSDMGVSGYRLEAARVDAYEPPRR